MVLYIVDGFSYIFRAFYAIPNLTNSKGFPTGAIYGFVSMLYKIIRDKSPAVVAVAFDSREETNRSKLYPLYKANRKTPPQELTMQIDPIIEIVRAMGIGSYAMPGLEADDLIGAVANKARREFETVFIVSADKDMLQCVRENVLVYDPVKDIVIDEAAVIERFGVTPERIPEFLALTGDSSDNIPGVKGVGEKTAKELLREFDSIEGLIGGVSRIKREKLRGLISSGVEDIMLSKRLATLEIDIDVDSGLKAARPDNERLRQLFTEYGLKSLLRHVEEKPFVPEVDSSIVDSVDRLDEILENGSDKMAWVKRGGVFITMDGRQVYRLESREVIEGLIVRLNVRRIYCYDLKSLMHNNYNGLFNSDKRIFDLMLAYYLINPDERDFSFKNIMGFTDTGEISGNGSQYAKEN